MSRPNHIAQDSAIIPPITLSIPMPEGAAIPPEPQITPVQSSAPESSKSKQKPE